MAKFFEGLSKFTFGGTQSAQMAMVAIPDWLRAGAKHPGPGPSYLSTAFFDQVSTNDEITAIGCNMALAVTALLSIDGPQPLQSAHTSHQCE